MQIITLTGATIQLNSVNLQNSTSQITGPSVPTATSPVAESTQSLAVSGNFMVGTTVAGYYSNSFPLSQAETDATPISKLEDLAVSKVKAALGLS